MPSIEDPYILFDAGIFIGALLLYDTRHEEARPLVEAARRGDILCCTTTGILSEVYAALTWQQAQPPHDPRQAAEAVALLIAPPSKIRVLSDGLEQANLMLVLSESHQLRARRVHDARHAAAALVEGVTSVFTYDPDDWIAFEAHGLRIDGPISTLARLGRPLAVTLATRLRTRLPGPF